MLLNLKVNRVDYVENKQDVNNKLLALPAVIKDCVHLEDYEKIVNEFNMTCFENRQEEIIIRKFNDEVNAINFFGIKEIDFVFKDKNLSKIVCSTRVKYKASQGYDNLSKERLFYEFLNNREHLINLMLGNKNNYEYFSIQDNEKKLLKESPIEIKDLMDNPKIYLNKELDVESYLPLKALNEGRVSFAIYINDNEDRDRLSLTSAVFSSEMNGADSSVKEVMFTKEKNKWMLSQFDYSKNGLRTNCVYFKDKISVHRDDKPEVTLPFELSKYSVDSVSTLCFFDTIEDKIQKIKLPKMFKIFGFRTKISLEKELDAQFSRKRKKNWSKEMTAIFYYLKHIEHPMVSDLSLKNVSDEDFRMLFEMNFNEEDVKAIMSKIEILECFYNEIFNNVKILKQDNDCMGFRDRINKMRIDVKQKNIEKFAQACYRNDV